MDIYDGERCCFMLAFVSPSYGMSITYSLQQWSQPSAGAEILFGHSQ